MLPSGAFFMLLVHFVHRERQRLRRPIDRDSVARLHHLLQFLKDALALAAHLIRQQTYFGVGEALMQARNHRAQLRSDPRSLADQFGLALPLFLLLLLRCLLPLLLPLLLFLCPLFLFLRRFLRFFLAFSAFFIFSSWLPSSTTELSLPGPPLFFPSLFIFMSFCCYYYLFA